MRYRPLGGTGMLVSEIALGTATFGNTVDGPTAAKLVGSAIDAGINLIDTADVYGQGRSEEILGTLIGARRDQLIVCTKVGSRVGDTEESLNASKQKDGLDHAARWRAGIAPTDRGLSRKHLITGLEASLRRLRTDYIDLYQLHRFDPLTPVEETLSALDDLVRSGKVRAVGCSGWAAWQLYRGLWLSDMRNLVHFQAQQVPYSVLDRTAENELLPALQAAGLGILTFRTLAGGLLSGRYLDGAPPDPASRMGSRALYQQRYFNPPMLAGAAAVAEAATARGCSTTSLSLSWVLAQPGVTSVLWGASRVEQIDDAVAATESPLSFDEAEALAKTVRTRVEATGS